MLTRILQSILVGFGAAALTAIFTLLGIQVYVNHFVARQHGIGAVAGGIAISLPVMAFAFCIGLVWNWHITRKPS